MGSMKDMLIKIIVGIVIIRYNNNNKNSNSNNNDVPGVIFGNNCTFVTIMM